MDARVVRNRNGLIKRLRTKYYWDIKFYEDSKETWAFKNRAGLFIGHDEWVLYDTGMGEPMPIVVRGIYGPRTTQNIMRGVNKIGR